MKDTEGEKNEKKQQQKQNRTEQEKMLNSDSQPCAPHTKADRVNIVRHHQHGEEAVRYEE
jgi:hypothetical protein